MSGPKISVAMHALLPTGVGHRVGYVEIAQTREGLRFDARKLPDLRPYGVQPGPRGFHVHEFADLTNPGCHYDPEHTKTHRGPFGMGHRGDLPALWIGSGGRPTAVVLAPRLALHEIMGRSLIIHEGGDNYTDEPKNGGGGRRALGGMITPACPHCRGGR
jgi:Cu-Zn family superoxide dismutase